MSPPATTPQTDAPVAWNEALLLDLVGAGSYPGGAGSKHSCGALAPGGRTLDPIKQDSLGAPSVFGSFCPVNRSGAQRCSRTLGCTCHGPVGVACYPYQAVALLFVKLRLVPLTVGGETPLTPFFLCVPRPKEKLRQRSRSPRPSRMQSGRSTSAVESSRTPGAEAPRRGVQHIGRASSAALPRLSSQELGRRLRMRLFRPTSFGRDAALRLYHNF